MGEFTYESYGDLLAAGVGSGYRFLPVRDYLAREEYPDRFVVLRHDVDRKPANALDLARIEAELGVRSTYYFRAVDGTFEPELMREIETLGHEVGYHYEDLDRADGDVDGAHESFARNLSRFREHVTVDTVCMHGNPLTPYDNRDMWAERSVEAYDLAGEAYLSVDFTDVTYFTDTNRTWYDEKTIADDWPVGPATKPTQVTSTSDLVGLVEGRQLDRLYLLAHPDRWAETYPEMAHEVVKDAVYNAGKAGLYYLR